MGDVRPLFLSFFLQTAVTVGVGPGRTRSSMGKALAEDKKTGLLAGFSKVPTPDGERNRGDPDFPAGVGDS